MAASINVVKFVNGQDADSPTGPHVAAGSTVTFTYVVTNTGSVTLSNVAVRDDNGTAATTADDFNPAFSGGDTNANGLLDLTETWTYTTTATALAGQRINVGTVTGQDANTGTLVTDDNLANYFGDAANAAPVNAVPGTQNVEANTATAITGLSVADPDAAFGTVTTTLSAAHGTLTAASAGGASVSGSGTANVTLTGTLAQINTTLGAANNVVYTGAHDFFGTDTLTVLTNDGGNTGAGGPLTDTDTVTINVNTLVTGTPGNDSFNALPGQERIDCLGGIDTITFNFKLVDATANKIIIDGPTGSHTVLTGLERFVFTDGTVDNADGSPLIDDLFYYSRSHDVWNAHVDADAHYNSFGWHENRDPSAFFSTSTYLSANPDVKAASTVRR